MLLALIGVVFAETIHCEATKGPALVYELYSKSGGAMPSSETLMDSQRWTLDGATIHYSGSTYGGDITRTGDVDWRWDTKSTKVEKVSGDKLNRLVTYTTQVTLWGEPKLNGGAELTVSMRCVRDPEMGIP